jgi:hypothetical protein
MEHYKKIPEGHTAIEVRPPLRGDRYLCTDGRVRIAAKDFRPDEIRTILRCDDLTKERNALGWKSDESKHGEWTSDLGHRIFLSKRLRFTLVYDSNECAEFESYRDAMRYAAQFPLSLGPKDYVNDAEVQ